ncbi:P-loop containing nucleoside triphosphate hydrolase protein [Phlegmacium glaucopus]|nr:P-loop containing nucleoside triphosphate hydrolase protein [Phlegmacium glaucopus]
MSSSRSLLSLGLQKEVLAALTRNGYENLRDLTSATAEGLAKDINIPIADARALIDRCQMSQTPALTLPMTQSAAVMVRHSHKVSTKCSTLDKALEGGISRGHITEISGPPGCAKEQLLMNIVAAFLEVNEEVMFIDCQNMTSPATLIRFLKRFTNLPPNFKQRIHYTKIHTLPELMLFLHQLASLLKSHPKISLVVFNSFYFPFQNAELGISQMKPLYEKVKETFSQACASGHLTIVTTSQLSIKMINADGSSGSYDSGAHGVLSPFLGDLYLPHAKAHRVMLCPDGPDTGFVIFKLSLPQSEWY